MEFQQLFLEAFPIYVAFPRSDLCQIVSTLNKYGDCTNVERSARTINDLLKCPVESTIPAEDAVAYVINAIFPSYSVTWLIKYITEKNLFGFEECLQKLLRKIAKKYLKTLNKSDLISLEDESCIDETDDYLDTTKPTCEQNRLNDPNDNFNTKQIILVREDENEDATKIQVNNLKRPFAYNLSEPTTSNHNIKKIKHENYASTSKDMTIYLPTEYDEIDIMKNEVTIRSEDIPTDNHEIVIDLTKEEDPQIMVKEEENENHETTEQNGELNVILSKEKEKMCMQLKEIFPETEPDFIRTLCIQNPDKNLDDLITEILSTEDLPKRAIQPIEEIEIDQDKHYDMLIQLFPDADPTYLRSCLDEISSGDELQKFITKTLEKHDYPSYKDYLRKKQLSAQAKQYTTEFNVEKYLQLIPDPDKYFKDPNNSKIGQISKNSAPIMMKFLTVQYPNIPTTLIKNTLKNSKHLFDACNHLDNVKSGFMKRNRKISFVINEIQNIPLLQLIAYIKNKEEINNFLKTRDLIIENERKNAKETNSLLTCLCCFDDEVLVKEAIFCTSGCICCKTCIQKNIEISYGEGKLNFNCLQDCGVQFSLQELQNFINPKLFSKIVQKKQLEEVKAAGIEELEFCPFCDFATIPAVNDKIFKCLNPDCMKESCRECKEPSHVPYKCNEIEKDADVKKRTYIENKMSEALMRKCYKCNKTFIKLDGCNKIICSCGAKMCYVCNKPITDYNHFDPGQGKTKLCPLTSDTNKLHRDAVMKSAATAKVEIGASNLKIDPTADLHKHYGTYPRRIRIKNRKRKAHGI